MIDSKDTKVQEANEPLINNGTTQDEAYPLTGDQLA